MTSNKNVLRIVSLIIAICLWVYVMGEVNPETKAKIGDIAVGYTNTEVLNDMGLAIAEKDQLLINATIKGKRSDVNDIKKKGLTAYVDVADCEEGKNTVNIQINLPEGIRLENISKENAEITVEKLVSETKAVEINFTDVSQENDETTPWITSYTPEEIIVSGAESSVAAIEFVEGIVDASEVTEESTNVEVVLTPMGKDGKNIAGVDMSYEIAYADVQLLYLKEVGANIDAVNLQPGIEIEELVPAEEITIVGTKETLKNINSLDAELDMTGVTSSGTVNMNINLPEGVYLYNTDSQAVKVVLKK